MAPWLTARYWRRPLARQRRLLTAGLIASAVAAGLRVLAPAPAPTVPLLVAARDLPAGAVLTARDVRTAQWPRGSAPAGVVVGTVGRRLAGAVRRGEPLTDVRLRGPGVLAGQDPSTRAVVVRLATSTAGLVRPGDRVDVVAVGAAGALSAGDGSGDGQSDGPGTAGAGARIVAEDALVLDGPTAGRAAEPDRSGHAVGSGWTAPLATSEPDGAGELLVLAVDRSTAVDLATASLTASLSVVMRGLS